MEFHRELLIKKLPRSSLQVRLSGVTDIGAKPGHPTTLTAEEENKIVDFACNRAS